MVVMYFEVYMYDLLYRSSSSHNRVPGTCFPGWDLCDLHDLHIFSERDLYYLRDLCILLT